MDRGEGQEHNLSSAEGVAAAASSRVGAILAEAERDGRAVNDAAERTAAETLRSAQQEVERSVAEVRESAREAARERVERLAALQAALTSRGPAVVDGLEGAGITRARLESLIEALEAAAERVMAEAEAGEPASGTIASAGEGGTAPAAAEEHEASPDDSGEGDEPGEPDVADAGASSGEPDAEAAHVDPVAAAEGLAQPVADAVTTDEPESGSGDETPTEPGNAGGDGSDDVPERYEGPLPEGAPLARRPVRSRERDARFAALLLAVQGRDRVDVKAHLRAEYGFQDCDPILDEVFGRTPA